MSTSVFDQDRLPALREQAPQRPWRHVPARSRVAISMAVIVPFLIFGSVLLFTDIPAALVMVAIYFPLQVVGASFAAVATKGARSIVDSFIITVAIAATVFSVVVIGSLLLSLIFRGGRALSVAFVSQNNVYISPSTPLGYGGIGHALLGTMLIVAVATLITMPIGVATALYITEVRGRAVPYVRFFVQAMSGVPSVVAGLFVLTVLILTDAIPQGIFAGGVAYAILMLPTVARTAEEVLKLVPDELRTGALALGSTRAKTVWQVVIPAAKTGIITAMILGLARVVGETAPLLLTAGDSDQTILNPFGGPAASLPTYIFGNVGLPYPDAVARAWGAALVLIIVVAVLFTFARILGRGRARR